MSDKSAIEWTDATWNPVRGCTKISPGCKHCYAETFAERFRGVPGHPYEQGFDLRLVPHKLLEPFSWTTPRMIFVNSMSDLFQDRVPDSYIQLAFEIMLAADWHTYQVLTKRADRMAQVTNDLPFDLGDAPHVWLGVSVEDRKYGVPRIDALRRARAAVRFLSVEPLLEDVGRLDLRDIDWVIVGGESGRGARPMREAWVRNVLDQCATTGVAFFFKQWGGVHKKRTGRTLDGRTWDGFPPRRGAAVPPRPEIARRRNALGPAVALVEEASERDLVFLRQPVHVSRSIGRVIRPGTSDGPTMPIGEQQRGLILQMLADGHPKPAIAEALDLRLGQVAAVAAHVTMGKYSLPPPSGDARRSLPRSGADFATEDEALVEAPETDASATEGSAPVLLGGAIADGRPVFWSPTPSSSAPNPHLLIIGSSGAGKTYATLCIVAELAQRGLPSIVFDYGQGFADESLPPSYRESTGAVEIDVARDGIAINPLTILPTDVLGPVNVGQRVADTIQRVFAQVGVQQHAMLRDAVIDVLSDAGIERDAPSTWKRALPELSSVREKLRTYAGDKSNPSRRYAASLEAHISSLFVFNTFRETGARLSWSTSLRTGRPTILQLRGLEKTLERAVTELLLWSLIGHLEGLGPGPMRCFAVLDEAHKLPMRPGSPVDKLLREGRKFGVGAILASQQPEDFSPVVYGNTSTKLIFRLEQMSSALASQLADARTPSELDAVKRTVRDLRRGVALVVANKVRTPTTIAPLSARVVAHARHDRDAVTSQVQGAQRQNGDSED